MRLPATIAIRNANGTTEFVPTYDTPYPEIMIRLLMAVQDRLDAIERLDVEVKKLQEKLEENKNDA